MYCGGAGDGSKENEDKNVTDKATEVFFQNLFGEKLLEQEGVGGQDGVALAFRTKQFNATGEGEPAELTANPYLVATGSGQ